MSRYSLSPPPGPPARVRVNLLRHRSTWPETLETVERGIAIMREMAVTRRVWFFHRKGFCTPECSCDPKRHPMALEGRLL